MTRGATLRYPVLVGLGTLALALAAPVSGAQAATSLFKYTGGEQTFTVPEDINSLEVLAVGASGGAIAPTDPSGEGERLGGEGAVVRGDIGVVPGETLYVEVGGPGGEGAAYNPGGFNGGGEGAGGGGGASDVRTAPRAEGLSPHTRLIVAGGGGGAGHSGGCIGGDGGSAGERGEIATEPGKGGCGNEGGGPGGATSGGAGGEHGCGYGASGELGIGGNGGLGGGSCNVPGGGGGGGLYGGGGGSGAEINAGGGGGGGSSLVPAGGTLGLAAPGSPEVRITYTTLAEATTSGATGETGPAGSTGATGPTGARGVTGATGAEGATGIAGASGPAGAIGLPGSTGAQGEAGPTGTSGETGPAGGGGATGATGANGPSGQQGPAGATGSQGASGPTGVIGATGKAGTTGATGASGPPGSQHIYSGTSPGGTGSQTLTLTAPAGADYVVSFDAQASVLSPLRPLTCALRFGPKVGQTKVLTFGVSPVEVYLQGLGALASGTITVTCTSEGTRDSVSNMSLIAYAGTTVD
jgi:hypothetical protein